MKKIVFSKNHDHLNMIKKIIFNNTKSTLFGLKLVKNVNKNLILQNLFM